MANKKINQLDSRVGVALTDLSLVGDPASGTSFKLTLNDISTIMGVPGKFNQPTGTAAQYIRGDGQLATFPSTASGGSSVNYYLNGSVNASVAGYKQLANTATIGGGTDFTLVGNGLIAQFLTDSGNPNRVEIPGGAWNFEIYFQVSSAGGNQKFYVELLKYDGVTFTSIASGITVPEEITGGTSIDLYLTSLAVPTTALLVTDRLAIRVYIVDNAGGRTVTLHTEDNTLCEIITTFSGGIAALNGLSANTQYLATGTSGTDFNISSLTDTHTFNLPTASATNRGALNSADWSTFNAKVPTTRTLTINGTAYDLSADRSWTVSGTNIYTSDGTLTGDRTVSNSTFLLKLVGGKEILTNEQTALRLETSITGKELIFSLNNLSGKNWLVRSLSSGNLDFRNITNSRNSITLDGASSDVTFSGNIKSSLDYFILGAGAFHKALHLGKTSVTSANYSIAENGAETMINADTGGLLRFRIANADKMMLTNAGRLLIGTTSESTYLLDVNGTARVSPASGQTLQIHAQTIAGLPVYAGLSGGGVTIPSTTNYGLVISNNGNGIFLNGGQYVELQNAGSTRFQCAFNTGNIIIQNGGTFTDVASARLTINSTTQGFLPPRMTTTEKNAIGTPAAGLQVYDTTLNQMSYYNGTTWVNF